jgi:hypothetical protein
VQVGRLIEPAIPPNVITGWRRQTIEPIASLNLRPEKEGQKPDNKGINISKTGITFNRPFAGNLFYNESLTHLYEQVLIYAGKLRAKKPVCSPPSAAHNYYLPALHNRTCRLP